MSASLRALTCFLVVGLATTALAEEHFQVTEIAPDLLLLTTDQGSYSNNSLVFTGEDGLLLVDTHHDGDKDAFKEFIDGLGYGPPRYIISTHRHVEHIGGNALWGDEPVVIAHEDFAEKLLSGTFLFSEYPDAAFPDLTVADSLQISFNGETIRLACVGVGHDDNEILVHFTGHGIAHISSTVNGFNFPSVDGDGDPLGFEAVTRQLMTLLPRGTRLVSGHHGQAAGYDVLGEWDQLPAYAEMMKETVAIVRREVEAGRSAEAMQESGVLDAYEHYAGSYVGVDEWIATLVDALTDESSSGEDICKPIYEAWKADGAAAAVAAYAELLEADPERYDFSEFVLLGIGSKLYSRGLYGDSVEFLLGCNRLYPAAEYSYYNLYLAAQACREAGRTVEALELCRESVRLNSDFARSSALLTELSEGSDQPNSTSERP